MRLKCVYRHITIEGNLVFYVGIGSRQRAFSKFSRSKAWRDFTSSHEYYVDIVAEGLEWKDACDLEVFLISIYGRSDKGAGILLNMSDGGEGNNGYIPSEVNKKQHSVRMKGSGNPNFRKKMSDDQKQKISKTRKENRIGVGENNPMFGKTGSMKGRFGKDSPMFGKITSAKTSELIRNKLKGGNCYCAKLVLCTETGIFYDCIKDAAKSMCISYNSLKAMLSGRYKNVTSIIYC
jgi:hypothetical protein